MPKEPREANIAHHAYAFSRPFPPSEPVEKRFWRYKEAMGFGTRGHDGEEHPKAPPCECWPKGEVLPDRPDIIVISEGGMGYRDSEKCWQSLALNSPSLVILKTAAPIASGDLWKKLKQECCARLVVVVAATELRKCGARISSGPSWEATFQDLLRGIGPGVMLADLMCCRHLVVTFGSEGAAWFDLPKGERAQQSCSLAVNSMTKARTGILCGVL